MRGRGSGTTAVLALMLFVAGIGAAVVRWSDQASNPDGIVIAHPRQDDLPGERYGFLDLSPGGDFYAFIGDPFSEEPEVFVVDAVEGEIVGRLSGQHGERLRYGGWRSPDTLWVGTWMPSDPACTAAFSASAPAWMFGADECSRRPEGEGEGFEYRRATSPDGVLTAMTVYDRSTRGLNSEPIPDVRLVDSDHRFLAQLGDMILVGWAADASLVVLDDDGPSRITRAEVDALVRSSGGMERSVTALEGEVPPLWHGSSLARRLATTLGD